MFMRYGKQLYKLSFLRGDTELEKKPKESEPD